MVWRIPGVSVAAGGLMLWSGLLSPCDLASQQRPAGPKLAAVPPIARNPIDELDRADEGLDGAKSHVDLPDGTVRELREYLTQTSWREAVAWTVFCKRPTGTGCRKVNTEKVLLIGVQSPKGSTFLDSVTFFGKAIVIGRMRAVGKGGVAVGAGTTALDKLLKRTQVQGNWVYFVSGSTSTSSAPSMYAVWLDDRDTKKARVVKFTHRFWRHRGNKHLDPTHGDVQDNDAGAALRQMGTGTGFQYPVVVRPLSETEPPPLTWPIQPSGADTPRVSPMQPPGTGPWFSCLSGCCTTGNLDDGTSTSTGRPAARRTPTSPRP